ncbi:MAG: DUF2207 domain-containing protein [Anaerolineae bacterium]
MIKLLHPSRWLTVVFLAGLLVLLSSSPTRAQGLQVSYPRFDVDIAIEPSGSFVVTETQTVNFSNGTSRFGYTEIPLRRVDSITDVTVGEPNSPYRLSTSQQPGTYKFSRQQASDGSGEDVMRIDWYYLPASGNKTFQIKYRVNGGLWVLPEGDQLYWTAIRNNRPGPVAESTVTVHLPQAAPADQIKAEGAVDARTETSGSIQNGQTVQFTPPVLPLGRNDYFEARVQFPHGMVAAAPAAWQAQAEQQDYFDQNIKPVFNLAALALAIFIGLGGALAVLIAFLTNGRDPAQQLKDSSIIVREPPTELPPAVVGVLVDERADERDIVSTLVDLANRGIISIQEEKNEKLVGSASDFRFTLNQEIDRPALSAYEQTLLRALFGDTREFMLSDIKGRFYTSMSQWEQDLYADVAQRRLFTSNPEATRRRWRKIGVTVAVLGVLGTVLGICMATSVVPLAILPGLALVFIGVLLLIVGPHMPKRTAEGVRQAGQWIAFKRYLSRIREYETEAQAKTLFNRYLAYAVAFGIDQTWVRKFAGAGVPAPQWFNGEANMPFGGPQQRGGGPVIIMPGPWIGGYGPGRHHGGGTGGTGGTGAPPNLDDVSGSLADMLSRAAETLAQGGGSGWSGGGGGWGGGGGGGGGGGSGFG